MSKKFKSSPPTQLLLQSKIQLPFEFKTVDILGIPFAYRQVNEDLALMRIIFQNEEYLLPLQNFQPRLILDCGANIGCSAVYFNIKYPHAKIYAVEPQEDNFALLNYNAFPRKNIHAIKSAVWDKETFIRVEDRGFETTEDDPEAFKTVTISKILSESGFDEIDLLKIDIEGAEKEVSVRRTSTSGFLK